MKKIILALVIFGLLTLGIFYFISFGKEKEKKELTNSEAVVEALKLYQKAKEQGIVFFSQCLGVVGDYAVDIVHVPRNEEDDKEENQCKEYREGKVNKFIELDKDGNIFRIA